MGRELLGITQHFFAIELKWSLSAWEAKVKSRDTVVTPELFGFTPLSRSVTVIPKMYVLLVRSRAVEIAASARSLLALYQFVIMVVLAKAGHF